MLDRATKTRMLAEYRLAHQNPTNRLLHLIGIPCLWIAGACWLAAIAFPALWPLALVLTVLGIAIQFAGHAFEGNRPEFLRDWRFTLIGTAWWLEHMLRPTKRTAGPRRQR